MTTSLTVRSRSVGRIASVRLTKRIPVGAGLGGGSADAAAVLRWGGMTSTQVAAQLGSDVPFCLLGGRARVTGVGELVTPLPFEDRRFVMLLPPISVDTGAVYRAWDYLHVKMAHRLMTRNLRMISRRLLWSSLLSCFTGARPSPQSQAGGLASRAADQLVR